MTDTQEYPWIKHYPEGVPATINPDIYESLPDFQEKICQEYGDAPVFTSLGKTMTYKEFDEIKLGGQARRCVWRTASHLPSQ